MTDLERWRRVATEPSPWAERLRLMAAHISPGESVLDVGSGSRELRWLLPEGCAYQAMDCIPGPDVIACDLDDEQSYQAIKPWAYDVAVLSGVLEYVSEPKAVLGRCARWARRLLFSYVFRDWVPSMARREENGWRNHLSLWDLAQRLHQRGGLGLGWRPVCVVDDQVIIEAGPHIWAPDKYWT